MPLPLLAALPWILGAVAAGGAVAGAVGISDMNDAKEIAEKAKRRHEEAVQKLEERRQEVMETAELYGNHLIAIQKTTFARIVELLSRIGARHRGKSYEILKQVGISPKDLDKYRQGHLYAESIVEGGAGAVAAGAAASSGATAAAVLFGTASTGAAISGLSGAAATSATMAWFGGGALTAGGGGMALGSAVLGGVVLAPALLVGGFVLVGKGEKALSKARQFEAEADIQIEKVKTVREFLVSVIRRIGELGKLTTELDRRAQDAMAAINVARYNDKDKNDLKKLQKALMLIKGLSEIMKVPIIGQDGEALSDESLVIQTKYGPLVEK